MKKIFFFFIICLAALYACSDNMNDLGIGILPEGDNIASNIEKFDLETATIPFENGVYANATTYLIGKHDDSRYGTIEASLLATIQYPENFDPSGIVADSLRLRLTISSHLGEEPLMLKVYRMKNKLNFSKEYHYHTNIKVEDFVDFAQELGTKDITQALIHQIDTTFEIYIKLKKELAQELLKANYYTSETTFQNYFNGIYVKSSTGNTMLNVTAVDLMLDCHSGQDTTTFVFPSNNEVKKVNAISPPKPLVQKTETYIYTPATSYAQVTIPVSEILEKIYSDPTKIPALNSVLLTVEAEEPQIDADSLSLPFYLALLPENEISTFFEEKNNSALLDRKTRFYTSLASDTTKHTYTYTFDLTYYLQKKIEEFESNYDKALHYEYYALASVVVNTQTGLKNEPKLTAITIKNKPKITVIYSEFHKFEKK